MFFIVSEFISTLSTTDLEFFLLLRTLCVILNIDYCILFKTRICWFAPMWPAPLKSIKKTANNRIKIIQKGRRSSMVTHWVAVARIWIQIPKWNLNFSVTIIFPWLCKKGDNWVVWILNNHVHYNSTTPYPKLLYRERHSLRWLNLGHVPNSARVRLCWGALMR